MSSSPCPFCNIAANNPPAPLKAPQSKWDPSESSSNATAHLILSTKHLLAFLDIMPLTRGHVLVAPRKHYEMLGDVGVAVGQEMGKWLPILSRVVTKTVFGDDPDRHWNVVQNNGERGAQQVPHVHFHIIPRPNTDSAHKPTFVMFGRGQREELDDEEGGSLAKDMRAELAREIDRVQMHEGVDLGLDAKQRGKL
ncbi:Histidine triad (HIT) protein [Penicillium hispanicum]|uniref:Histidine triad (HIT) protein n=1 Tax=Penicillium hispanicum TaxID=1080232 RepID=UPI00253FB6D3|nr:Histidine triad (HIT) protein [Penicillium hispanicum]KAJ5570160.1 Histidine triad (HIT) protein [Penicillium hispanicum]